MLGHVAANDPLSKPLDDCRFSNAGLPDQAGVVLALSREDADDVADLLVPPDHGVELLRARKLGQILPVFFKRIVGVLGGGGGDAGISAHRPQSRE